MDIVTVLLKSDAARLVFNQPINECAKIRENDTFDDFRFTDGFVFETILLELPMKLQSGQSCHEKNALPVEV